MKRTITAQRNYFKPSNSIKQVQSRCNNLESTKTLSYESTNLLNEIFNLLPENQNNFYSSQISTGILGSVVPIKVPSYIKNEEVYNFLQKLEQKEKENQIKKEETQNKRIQQKQETCANTQIPQLQSQVKKELSAIGQVKQELSTIGSHSVLEQCQYSNEEQEKEQHLANMKKQKKVEKKLLSLINKSKQLFSCENGTMQDILSISSLQIPRIQQILNVTSENQDEYLEQKFGNGADKIEILFSQPNNERILDKEKVLCMQCYNYIEVKRADNHWKNCKKLENEFYAKKFARIKDINERLKLNEIKITDFIRNICLTNTQPKEINRLCYFLIDCIEQSMNCNLDFLELNVLLLDLGALTDKLLAYDLQPLYKIISLANRTKTIVKEKALLLQFVQLKKLYKIEKLNKNSLNQSEHFIQQAKQQENIIENTFSESSTSKQLVQIQQNTSQPKLIERQTEQPMEEPQSLSQLCFQQQNLQNNFLSNLQDKSEHLIVQSKPSQSNQIMQNPLNLNQPGLFKQFLKSTCNQQQQDKEFYQKKEELLDEDLPMSILAKKFLHQKIQNKECYFNQDLSYQQEQEEQSSCLNTDEQELAFSLHDYKIKQPEKELTQQSCKQSFQKLSQKTNFNDFDDIFKFKKIQDNILKVHNDEFGEENLQQIYSESAQESENFDCKIEDLKNHAHPFTLISLKDNIQPLPSVQNLNVFNQYI